jgi:magnesium transporter
MQFELTKDFLETLRIAANGNDEAWVDEFVTPLHHADIAELLDELNVEQSRFIYYRLEEEKQADVLMDLEEEVRDRFVKSLSSKEIAEQLDNLDSDDAVDILEDLSEKEIKEVIAQMEDDEAIEDIVELLNYDEDTAGGLMQKEFIQANLEWPVDRCLVELRRQAEDVEQIYTIYVVDNLNRLVGLLSLKRLLFATPKTPISSLLHEKNIISVSTSDSHEFVAQRMEKYDLVSIPVVDLQNKLVGRITIDDVVDVIKDEADRDFQLAAGLSEKVEDSTSVFRMSRARLPWLLIGMIGGVLGAQVISSFKGDFMKIPVLAFFIPLITAMGGNVGVQSSAIVVQSLAKGNHQFGGTLAKLRKEFLVALLNGTLCAADLTLGFVVSISLFTVIIFAAIFGTFIPLVLNNYKIDPALATGPFVTTLNDVLGLFIYFTVGGLLYGI